MAGAPGTVGRSVFGELHILDDEANPCPVGTIGTVWFRLGSRFEYFNDRARTAEVFSADGTMGTVGDVGYVDADGYLYLTDRVAFTIISGGVNIYPQECEDLLITHPKVADAAVFGIPNADLGEEVKAAVQLMPGIDPGTRHRSRTARLLRAASRTAESPAVDRFRGRTAAASDGQAV